jgi:hypothetical protein
MGAPPSRPRPRRATIQAERLALFLCALHREEAAELLEGLAPASRRRAQAFAAEVLGWDSSRRQALLLLELGPRDQPEERVQALLEEAPAALRDAVGEALPGELRRHRPGATDGRPPSPGLRRLAARLVREALG